MTQKARFRELERYGFGPNVMKKNKVCARCGKLVKASTKTCPECGERLSNETLFDRYKRRHKSCPDCDTVLSYDSRYCPNCGTAVFHHENDLEGGKNDEKKGFQEDYQRTIGVRHGSRLDPGGYHAGARPKCDRADKRKRHKSQ